MIDKVVQSRIRMVTCAPRGLLQLPVVGLNHRVSLNVRNGLDMCFEFCALLTR